MPADAPDSLEVRLRHRESMLIHPLQTQPQLEAITPQGGIPNTPLVVSIISFLLGGVFALGTLTFVVGGFGSWWSTYQLGFFVAAWAVFHWGEFAVTAGWNLEKCSVDCKRNDSFSELNFDTRLSAFLLNNGSTYHIANGTALVEYLLALYFNPMLKSYPYVSELGEQDSYQVLIQIIEQFYRYNSSNRWTASAFNSHDSCFNKFFTFRGVSQA